MTIARNHCRSLGLVALFVGGCTLADKSLGQIGESTGEGNTNATDSTAGHDGADTAGSSTGETTGGEPGCVDDGGPAASCENDLDHDGVPLVCDNAPTVFNPSQSDADEDGLADEVDRCPLLAGPADEADSDKEGVGNDCDACRQTTAQYNQHDAGIVVPDYMLVRNVPWQGDADEDGIGDACDNCVVHSNCEDYGLAAFGAAADHPYLLGDPLMFDDPNVCQRDDDQDLVGDACAGEVGEGAAGPVGVGPSDDFDQDGLTNSADACPRQPVPDLIACTGDGDCAGLGPCDGDVCDHVDTDGDGVGDICDTCPFSANPMQTMDGGMQEEDEDGDFVGTVCETSSQCANRPDARPFSFYAVSANGLCCTTALTVDDAGNVLESATGVPLVDPDGLPVQTTCIEADDPVDRVCRKLPNSVAGAPGVLTLPSGCEDALAAAGITAAENTKLELADFDSPDALWGALCFLPQRDQDYDSLGDACDLCPFAFDPTNEQYTDDEGTLWPTDGKYCNGDYSADALCMP